MPIEHVALVGHCGFDSGSLKRFAKAFAPGAKVLRVNNQKELDKVAGPATLLLVNRVLDGRFDVGGSGIELIKTIAGQADASLTMLVSNYEDAQQEAVAAGALLGFGKSHVGDSATKQRLADAIAD